MASRVLSSGLGFHTMAIIVGCDELHQPHTADRSYVGGDWG
jgi:hypothetical protein